MVNIDQKQINLIYLAKSYIKNLMKEGIDTSISPFCYMAAQERSPGRERLINLMKKKSLSLDLIKTVLFNFISVGTQSNYKIINENENLENYKNINKIFLSWAVLQDFDKKGSFQDRKLGVNSKSDYRTLWVLIYQDKKLPHKIDKNIILIFKKKNLIRFNFVYFLKIFSKNMVKCKFSLKKFIHTFSYQSNLAEIINNKIKQIYEHSGIKSIVTPYESQPFQNKVFKEAQKNNIKTIGYTAVTQPFPSHNIYRTGSPDLLLVHSYQEKKHLINYLNWPKNKIKLINSINYKIKPNQKLQKKIFVPYIINYENTLLNGFEKLVKNNNTAFCFFKTQNHPYMSNSNKHRAFIKKLEIIKNKYKKKVKTKKNNASIFFGESYGIIELLSRGIEVYQICANPILESYSKKVWNGLDIKNPQTNVYKYKLKKNFTCIKFGNKNNNILKYLN